MGWLRTQEKDYQDSLVCRLIPSILNIPFHHQSSLDCPLAYLGEINVVFPKLTKWILKNFNSTEANYGILFFISTCLGIFNEMQPLIFYVLEGQIRSRLLESGVSSIFLFSKYHTQLLQGLRPLKLEHTFKPVHPSHFMSKLIG